MGSLPIGLIVAKLFYGTDIRSEGSGNIGAANMLRTLGRRAGALVLVLDALKGFVPTICALYLGGLAIALVAGFAAVVGHCYSPWMQFKGGKGVATALGVLFALVMASRADLCRHLGAGGCLYGLRVGRLAARKPLIDPHALAVPRRERGASYGVLRRRR